MKTRNIASLSVSAIGLGCMNLSHGYGNIPDAKAGADLLRAALDQGYSFFDTATMYGYGKNETLVGEALGSRRDEFVLASKCGLYGTSEGVRGLTNDPKELKAQCEDSLKRLNTDVIDLYYLHRWKKSESLEDAVGALGELVAEGKIRYVGLSEVSATGLRRAHAVHSIAAMQTEYSLWTRNPEIAVLEACRDLGTAFVAFSPVARGFLTGAVREARFAPGDLRLAMPRFQPESYARNLKLLDGYGAIAKRVGCTMAQLALAWLLAKGDDIIPIPGTTNMDHMRENAGGEAVTLDAETMAELDGLINQHTVEGGRYAPEFQAQVDTEEF